MTATETALTLARVAAQAAADKLAKDILLVDVSDRLAITDVFVIVTGANERQVGAIVDSVEEKMRAAGTRPPRREGERDGRWVLLDFLDVIVHVQHSEERVFYALDRLWKDCPTIPWTDASGDPGSAAAEADGRGDSPLTAAESVGEALAEDELAAHDVADELDPEVSSATGESETSDGDENSAADRPGVVASP
jgi:ribosome-associated protein